MLRKKGDTYEIDRELTGKLAIESNAELQEENEKLKEENRDLKLTNIAMRRVLLKLDKENKKLKETIKDHQLYEEKLEHRIIEFEELLH